LTKVDASRVNFALPGLRVTDLSLLGQRFRAFPAAHGAATARDATFGGHSVDCCACKTGSRSRLVNWLHPHKDTFFSESWPTTPQTQNAKRGG
jgi:hypothetical protein